MELLILYWSFLVIGFSSFGGLSMIPQISQQVLQNGWMTPEQVTDILAIVEMTPGPLGLNCATFAGMQAAGIPGALFANLGILTPSFTLGAVAAVCFYKYQNSQFLSRALVGIRPVCLGMVCGVLLSLIRSTYQLPSGLNVSAVWIGIIDLILPFKWKISIQKLILFSAGLGIIVFGVMPVLI